MVRSVYVAEQRCSSLGRRAQSKDGLKRSMGWNAADGAWSLRKLLREAG